MIIIGHRGAKAHAPENTVAGFRYAIDRGVRHFELDLRLSANNEIICFHDPSLYRAIGSHQKISQLNTKQLQKIQLPLNNKPYSGNAHIPTLEEVLCACPEVLSWQLEVKQDQPHRLYRLVLCLIKLLRSVESSTRFTVTSSHTMLLKLLQSIAPEIESGIIIKSPWQRPKHQLNELNCQLLVINWLLCTPGLVRYCHQRHIDISVWTVNSKSKVRHFKQLGVNSLITDMPAQFL